MSGFFADQFSAFYKLTVIIAMVLMTIGSLWQLRGQWSKVRPTLDGRAVIALATFALAFFIMIGGRLFSGANTVFVTAVLVMALAAVTLIYRGGAADDPDPDDADRVEK